MDSFNRQTCQTIIEKLDQNVITLAYAKSYLWAYTNIDIKARTKTQFIKTLCNLMKEDQQ